MIVTDTKIEVTMSMMQRANMIQFRGDSLLLGVPAGQGGLQWKDLMTMKDPDFDKIEEYFLSKAA